MTRLHPFTAHWSGYAIISAVLAAASLSSGCATNYLTNSNEGTYGVPVTERTIAQRLLDRGIEHTAKVNIYSLQPNLQQISRLSIDSFHSEVLLTGEVPTNDIKIHAEQIVSSMPDVQRVYNELAVGMAQGYGATVQDALLTSKMLAKSLPNNGVKSSQIKIVTNNSVVYVMGRVTPVQQNNIIDIANSTVGLTELVLLTSLIDEAGNPLNNEDVMFERTLDTYNASGMPAAVAPRPTVKLAASEQRSTSPYIELYRDQ